MNQTNPGTEQAAPSASRLEKPKQPPHSSLQYLPQGQDKVVFIIREPAERDGFHVRTGKGEKQNRSQLVALSHKCSGAILLDCDATCPPSLKRGQERAGRQEGVERDQGKEEVRGKVGY